MTPEMVCIGMGKPGMAVRIMGNSLEIPMAILGSTCVGSVPHFLALLPLIRSQSGANSILVQENYLLCGITAFCSSISHGYY